MSYAYLGQSCQTNMNVLIDNKKFFPLDDPVYKIFYTKMQRYPCYVTEKQPIPEETEKPEDIKNSKLKRGNPEEYNNSSCCGKK